MTANLTIPAETTARPLDPQAATDRYERTVAVVADSLAHMDAVLTAAEAELAIARYHHVHRLSHPPAGN